MKVYIDGSLCIACGMCEATVPTVFALKSGVAEVISEVSKEDEPLVTEAMEACPTDAIKEAE